MKTDKGAEGDTAGHTKFLGGGREMRTQFSCELINTWDDFRSYVAVLPLAVAVLESPLLLFFLAVAFTAFTSFCRWG